MIPIKMPNRQERVRTCWLQESDESRTFRIAEIGILTDLTSRHVESSAGPYLDPDTLSPMLFLPNQQASKKHK